MSTILYARVSTVEQTVEHQLVQAKAAGFVIDEVIAASGAAGPSAMGQVIGQVKQKAGAAADGAVSAP